MKLRTFAFCVFVLALAVTAFAADNAQHMKPGKWSISIQMDMPNMPMKMPPMTVERCVTQEQADHPEPPKGKNEDDCKISDYKLEGQTLTWTMKCEKQKMTGTGKMTFAPESYEGESQMTVGDMQMTQKFNGKYLGACDK